MNAAREVVPLPAPKATVAVEQVTAEVAAAWLGANTRNRGLRHARIDQYAEDMKAGRWHPTGETIKFSVSGRLLDGQHGAHRNIVLLNAAAGLVAGGRCRDLAEGLVLAAESVDSGAAQAVLAKVVAVSQEAAATLGT